MILNFYTFGTTPIIPGVGFSITNIGKTVLTVTSLPVFSNLNQTATL